MNRKAVLSSMLIFVLLFSGCLGFLSDDTGDVVTIDEDPLISANEVDDINYGGSVFVSGTVTDELPTEARVTIAFSIPWGTIYETPDEDGNWQYSLGGLEPGDYNVTFTVVDDSDQSSDTITKSFTVHPPIEQDVLMVVWRSDIRYEIGEETSVTGQLTHSTLSSCTISYSLISEVGGNSPVHQPMEVPINFDTSSGMFSISLGILNGTSNGTVRASCGQYTTSEDSVLVSFQPLEQPISDLDGDGIADEFDDCEDGESFSSSLTTDYDSDGCYDLTEDLDDDNDGIGDTIDNCQKGILGWISTPAVDKDSDGCRDVDEDDDDDGDTILDAEDSCLDSPYGWISNFVSDYDRDGCRDSGADIDDDNDGIADSVDDCPTGVIGWLPDAQNDQDSDGCRDADEDDDDDNDSVFDNNDSCPNTLANYSVNEFGCAAYEWDEDSDGVMDDTDACQGTPIGLVVNEQGCADLDGDGVFANIDQCADSPARWSVDSMGCAVIQNPVAWHSGPYSSERFGKAADFNFATKYDGNWQLSNQWDGNSTYIFIFLQSSSSYMNGLWGQSVGTLLDGLPKDSHIFFGSYDSDWQSDVDTMASRVSSYRNSQSDEGKIWVDDNVHFVYQQAGSIGGGLGSVISSWSQFYYGIDRFQQWREVGSLYNWAKTWSSDPDYRFDYLAKEPQMWNAEFPVEMRKHDPAITVVDLWDAQRHTGGWQGGHKSFANGTFPNATTMLTFNTMEVYMHHGCSEKRDRYQKGDGTWGGCHEWDYDQRLNICQEFGNHSTCGDEFVRYITTYGREGRWLTDISPYLFMLKDGGPKEFRYGGANGGWLNISVYLSTWDDDGMRPTSAEYAFSGGSFRGQYNNESLYKRVHDLTIPNGTDKVVISSVVTGHGFGKDDANCAEFCNHEHRFFMNGHVTQEDFPMAGNGTVASDREGCAKETDMGTVANQKGSWPYGRAGWCAGQDTKPWVWDITNWVDWSGGPNSLRYQGLYNGVNYVPQNEQSGANQDIRVVSYVIYYTNISAGNSSVQMDNAPPSQPLNEGQTNTVQSLEIEAWMRDKEWATIEE